MTKHSDENDILAAFDRRMSRSIAARRNLRSLSDEKSNQKKVGEHGEEDSKKQPPPFKPFYDS